MLYRAVLCQNIHELPINLLKYLVLTEWDIVFIIAYKVAFTTYYEDLQNDLGWIIIREKGSLIKG